MPKRSEERTIKNSESHASGGNEKYFNFKVTKNHTSPVKLKDTNESHAK